MPFLKDAWGSSQYERNLQMGFNIGGPSLIDIRLVLTKEMMENADDSVMPPKYFALCSDNDQIYYYDKKLSRVKGDPNEVALGRFRRLNIIISDIQDQYKKSLLGDDHVARIYVAKKLSDLVNDGLKDSEGLHAVVTDSNFKDYLDQFSTSEEGIFSHVARTGKYNDLLDKPFIPDDAIYVNYNDDLSLFDKLNGGSGEHHITIKEALDAIAKAFTDDRVLPIIIETDSEGGGKIRHVAEKLEIADKPFIAFKLNLSSFYDDIGFAKKVYVDSENYKQNVEIAKKQSKLIPANNSRIYISPENSEGASIIDTEFADIAYTGEYKDMKDKLAIYLTSLSYVDPIEGPKTKPVYFELDPGYVDCEGNPVNNLTEALQYLDIKEYSSEYERLRVEVDSEDGIKNRLEHVQLVDLPSKQDNLIAGDNVTIAPDGVTISAKDTLYKPGYNVALTADSAGELTVINTKDSRYIAGDNVTITSEGLDQYGNKYRIDAKDTKYQGGVGVDINPSGNIINVLVDGTSIIKDSNNVLHANAIGQYGAEHPIVVDVISGSEGVIKLQYDNETLVYNSDKLKVNNDNTTIKYNTTNKLHVPFDSKSFRYDNSDGKVKSTLTAGQGLNIDNTNRISVLLKDGTIKSDSTDGSLYIPIDGTSLYVDNDKLVAAGKVNLTSGTGITATGSAGTYTLDANIDGVTIKAVNDTGTKKKLVGGYVGTEGIKIPTTPAGDVNKIGHSNIISAGSKGGVINNANGSVTIPKVDYDRNGHIIASTNEVFVYPPLTVGPNNGYYSSDSAKGVWRKFDSAPVQNSEGGISSGAVYTALATKQDKLTAGNYINIVQSAGNTTISSTLKTDSTSSVSIDGDRLDVKVDNLTILKDATTGKLYASSGNIPVLYKVTIPTSAWFEKTDALGRSYYQALVKNFSTPNTAIDSVITDTTPKVPFITIDETAYASTAIEKYIQWSKVYHVDVIKDINDSNKRKLEFFSYEKPTVDFALICTLFTVNTAS